VRIPVIEKFLDELIERSTLDVPAWDIERIRRMNKSIPKAGWSYGDGFMIKAILEMYHITGEKRYYDFAEAFLDYRVDENGHIAGYEVEDYNIDHINAAKNLFFLYEVTGKEKYRKAMDTFYFQLATHPRTVEGNFWHKKVYPNQIWLDGLYMGLPFYIEYETKYNNKQNYEDIFNQYANVVKYMRDEKTGLYFHAYDASKKAFWCDKNTGLCENFWLRALGWYAMALLDTLEKCDPLAAGTRYEELKVVFLELIDSLLQYQDASGMWYQLPARGGEPGNYLETSGTAIMSYCILKAVRLKVLKENYRKYAEKAFQGIMDRYLSVDEEGKIHLDGICLVAGLGPEGNLRRDGSYEYYMSEPIVKDDTKGVAPFLLAYAELCRI